MEVITTIEDYNNYLKFEQRRNIVLVPTMGSLHEGHLQLVREARTISDNVVVSIFVNPLQFGPNEDFNKYPRDLDSDLSLLKSEGVSVVFTPDTNIFTPPDMMVSITPGEMGDVLCGKYRPGHFTGVCTIVTKLFNVIRPKAAVFGWKDAQQFLILKRMVLDLNIPVEMIGIETIRAHDGLALSSRNTYLTPEERNAAPNIYKQLAALKNQLLSNQELSLTDLAANFENAINSYPELQVQYIEWRDCDTLKELKRYKVGHTLLATAVYAGKTRLIDNVRF